jgi:hypothetical protein
MNKVAVGALLRFRPILIILSKLGFRFVFLLRSDTTIWLSRCLAATSLGFRYTKTLILQGGISIAAKLTVRFISCSPVEDLRLG